MPSDRAQAAAIMAAFAERTGVTGAGAAPDAPGAFGAADAPRRYLWTDAYAVLNWLDLARERGEAGRTGEAGRDAGPGKAGHGELARRLIAQVHDVLGRHRPDDPRTGWLSGLGAAEGACHPTRGGLRIGKTLPERPADEPLDERLEWDRDGQYWHYLTKWMEALARAAAILAEPRLHALAVELASATVPRFLRRGRSGRPVGLAWKMSIDLTRPLVPGQGAQDALDGYVTLRRLGDPSLAGAVDVLRGLAAEHDWATSDALGIGGLLTDAGRLAGLSDRGAADERLAGDVLAGAEAGLRTFLRQGQLDRPAARRLAFRELGLAIGLQSLPAVGSAAEGAPGLARAVRPHLGTLGEMAEVGPRIVRFWADPAAQQAAAWAEHRDINEVMLATALLRAQAETGTRADG